MKRFLKPAAILLLTIATIAVVVYAFSDHRNGASPTFRTAPVIRGDLQTAITATGTVQPEELVDVGAQVAGKIVGFGKDESGRTVDYGSNVEQGTVLAQIDDSLFAADVAQAEAQLAQAKAGLERAEADLQQLQARLDQAARDWSRARKLGPSEALSQSAYDAALSAHDVARANIAVGKAAIVQSKSSIAQAEANLQKARRNLEYCTIRSPVKGVIIDRRVNIGQTVVASLNAPSLFLIAKDLRRLQVWVAVNEADIGSIHPDQRVVFTVDAFPEETHEGRVSKIRLNAAMTQNVVSYIVEVSTDNSSGRLLPYLSANARFIVNERQDVLMVPNAALKWAPSFENSRGESPVAAGGGGSLRDIQSAGMPPGPPDLSTLWVQQGGEVRPVQVRKGLSDGTLTEVQGSEIREGMEVVIGQQNTQDRSASAATVNPFAPKNPWARRTSSQSK
jgi:HlyD family secretion protein